MFSYINLRVSGAIHGHPDLGTRPSLPKRGRPRLARGLNGSEEAVRDSDVRPAVPEFAEREIPAHDSLFAG